MKEEQHRVCEAGVRDGEWGGDGVREDDHERRFQRIPHRLQDRDMGRVQQHDEEPGHPREGPQLSRLPGNVSTTFPVV